MRRTVGFMHTPMPTKTSRTRRVLVPLWLLGGLALGACHATPPAAAPTAPAAAASNPQTLMDQIQAEIGTARCEQDRQCRSLPIGHKACGGPAGHLAWSTLVGNEARLRTLAQQHEQASRQAQEKRGLVSDCMLVSDPGARCNAQTQRCELNPRGRAGPSAL
jgi:hypothetical protein